MPRKPSQNPSGSPISHTAGVYEEEIHPPGEHWVKILMPSGNVGVIKYPDELWDDTVMPDLWRRYKEKTQLRLRIV